MLSPYIYVIFNALTRQRRRQILYIGFLDDSGIEIV